MRAVYSSLNLFPWHTVQEESSYWILRRSMARIMDCMAMKMFWYTSLMYVLFSSSGKPAPWMIFICLMNVDLPDSPVPVQDSFIANITFLRTWQICTLVSWASISGWRWQHNVAAAWQTVDQDFQGCILSDADFMVRPRKSDIFHSEWCYIVYCWAI